MNQELANHRRVRIGIDYRPALLSRSGIGRVARELARALAAADSLELRLFGHSLARCRTVDPAPPSQLWRWPIPGRTLPALHRLGLGADRLCGGVDVFHWTDYVYPPISRARAVLTVHDVSFARDESFHGRAGSRALTARCTAAVAAARRIIVPTEATATDARELLGAARDRLTVIPFGVDHVTRAKPGPDPREGRPFVLALGTIEPRKNHARLLEAWRGLDAPRPDLVVIGRAGWCCEETVTALRDAAARGEITWIEDASDDVTYAHLAHARVLAYPSRLEGFGFPPLEALAFGTPVLAGDTPALREVLGDAAAFCDPDSIEAIHVALARLLEHSDDADRRTRGRARAAHFRWADCAVAHARVYAEVGAA